MEKSLTFQTGERQCRALLKEAQKQKIKTKKNRDTAFLKMCVSTKVSVTFLWTHRAGLELLFLSNKKKIIEVSNLIGIWRVILSSESLS